MTWRRPARRAGWLGGRQLFVLLLDLLLKSLGRTARAAVLEEEITIRRTKNATVEILRDFRQRVAAAAKSAIPPRRRQRQPAPASFSEAARARAGSAT
jgi:hypothetical protein